MKPSISMPLRIPIRSIFWVLLAIVVALFSIHGLFLGLKHYGGMFVPDSFLSRLDPNLEANIPTWYSTILLACISASAFLIHWLRPTQPVASPISRWFWLTFGAAYAFLSMDEAAGLHELIDKLAPSSKWVFFYAPIAALFFLVCAYHLARERSDAPTLRNWILGGLLVTALGALLGEYLNYVLPMSDLVIRIEITLEEGLELLGTVLVLMGCLRELERRFNARFKVARAREKIPTDRWR